VLEGKGWDLSHGGDPNQSLIDVVECRYTVQTAAVKFISRDASDLVSRESPIRPQAVDATEKNSI